MGFLALRGAVQQAGIAGLHLHHQPPSPKDPLQKPAPDRGAHLTWLRTQVGVKALGLEHDEQRTPAQEDCGEKEVFQHSGAGHPPAAPMGSGQGGRHGAVWRWSGSGSADTLGHSGAPLAKRKGFSLSSLGGKLRHGSWKRANYAQGRGAGPDPKQD